MSRRITILGMGPTARERRIDILRYCADTDIWGLNNGMLSYPHLKGRWARYFELHGYDYLTTWDSGCDDYFRQLNDLDCPVYVTNPIPLVLNQHLVDWPMIMDHFGVNYFLGSPSLMMALALYEHDNGDTISEIRSWGIDTSDPQHAQQRHSWSFWCAMAHQRGIKFGGTAIDFMGEQEMDKGLIGLREWIGNKILEHKKQGDKETEVEA